jgi:Nuclease A inhibitor-like protein
MALSDAEIVDLLTTATADLDWSSESDEPFAVLYWPDWGVDKLDASVLATQVNAADQTPIAEVALDEFFQPAITAQDWHEAADRAVIKRYKKVVSALQQQLTELTVYRVGQTEVDVYILGKTPAGHWLALKTLVVES